MYSEIYVKKPVIPLLNDLTLKKVEPPPLLSRLHEKVPAQAPNFEAADEPESIMEYIRPMFKGFFASFVHFFKKYYLYILIAAGGYLALMTLHPFVFGVFVSKIMWFFIFIFGAYNGVFAKVLFFVLLFTYGRKIYAKIQKNGFSSFCDNVMALLPKIKQSFSHYKNSAYPLTVATLGIGIAFSNLLSRNNKIDKYAISFFVGCIIFISLTEGEKKGPFKFFRVLAKDISRILKRSVRLSSEFVYLLLTGVSSGLILSIFLAFGPLAANEFSSYKGFFIGLLMTGLALLFMFFQKKESPS